MRARRIPCAARAGIGRNECAGQRAQQRRVVPAGRVRLDARRASDGGSSAEGRAFPSARKDARRCDRLRRRRDGGNRAVRNAGVRRAVRACSATGDRRKRRAGAGEGAASRRRERADCDSDRRTGGSAPRVGRERRAGGRDDLRARGNAGRAADGNQRAVQLLSGAAVYRARHDSLQRGSERNADSVRKRQAGTEARNRASPGRKPLPVYRRCEDLRRGQLFGADRRERRHRERQQQPRVLHGGQRRAGRAAGRGARRRGRRAGRDAGCLGNRLRARNARKNARRVGKLSPVRRDSDVQCGRGRDDRRADGRADRGGALARARPVRVWRRQQLRAGCVPGKQAGRAASGDDRREKQAGHAVAGADAGDRQIRLDDGRTVRNHASGARQGGGHARRGASDRERQGGRNRV